MMDDYLLQLGARRLSTRALIELYRISIAYGIPRLAASYADILLSDDASPSSQTAQAHLTVDNLIKVDF
jgi:hypothetical protein